MCQEGPWALSGLGSCALSLLSITRELTMGLVGAGKGRGRRSFAVLALVYGLYGEGRGLVNLL